MEFCFRKIIFSSTHNCLSPRISRVVNTQLTGIASIPRSQAIIERGVYARRQVREAAEAIEKRQQRAVWEESSFTVPHSDKIHPFHSTGGPQGTGSAKSRKCFSSGLAHHVSNEGTYSEIAFATCHLWPTVLGRSRSNDSSFSRSQQRHIALFAQSSWIFPITSHSGIRKAFSSFWSWEVIGTMWLKWWGKHQLCLNKAREIVFGWK